jgi:hypothetical protein
LSKPTSSVISTASRTRTSVAAAPARRHAELTRALLRGYQLTEPDQTDAVRFVTGAFHGYLSLEQSGGFRHHPRT